MNKRLAIMSLLFWTGTAMAQPTCADLYQERATPRGAAVAVKTLKALESIHDLDIEDGVPEIHRTKSYLVRENNQVVKTPVTVVLYHGLLNSPAWMKWIAEDAHRMGYNVLNVRMPRHFTGDRAGLDGLKFEEVVRLAQQVTSVAEELSSSGKVVYVGHSTGGLTSLYSATQSTGSTAGLLLFSPSLGTSAKTNRDSSVLSFFGVSGWLQDRFTGYDSKTADPMNRYMSTFAGVQVEKMGQFLNAVPGEGADASKTFGLMKQRLDQMPILWIDTAIDKVIDLELTYDVATPLSKTNHYVFPKELGISHLETVADPMQAATPEQATAKLEMKKQWDAFLRGFGNY